MLTTTKTPVSECPPVKLDKRIVEKIGVREWSIPSMVMPGKVWRSEEAGTISCMVGKDATTVSIKTLPLVVLEPDGNNELPDEWRAAIWEYVQAWPFLGAELAPLLAITEKERCDFIRKMAKDLVETDDIGCRMVAHTIGELAAYGYRIVEPTEQP